MNRFLWNLIFCKSRRSFYLLFGICICSWISGLIDHAFETSFKEFTWPSSSHDVLSDTHKLIKGEKLKKALLNPSEKFPVLHTPRCGNQKFNVPNNLLIVVKSYAANSKNRDVIRQTWGNEHIIDDFSVRTIFVVGKFPNDKEHKSMKSALERESDIHKDILIADVLDTYRNNTAKLIYSLGYAYKPSYGCQMPNFVLLIDDDYMLSTHNLIHLLSSRNSQDLIYEGWRFDSSPFRFKLHKHAVPLIDYPYDHYPPYISAGCVLLSRATVEMFYHATKLVKIYSFDDIYAGILAHLLRIKATHNDGFIFWSRIISHNEWLDGKVIAAHGYDPHMLEEQFPLVRFTVPG